jgi:hypothetical protein
MAPESRGLMKKVCCLSTAVRPWQATRQLMVHIALPEIHPLAIFGIPARLCVYRSAKRRRSTTQP